mgnify:CR=1 FL=1
MLFLCYPKCSTCRKAQKWLDEHDVDYDIRDIKTDNPDLAELELWHQASGLPLENSSTPAASSTAPWSFPKSCRG